MSFCIFFLTQYSPTSHPWLLIDTVDLMQPYSSHFMLTMAIWHFSAWVAWLWKQWIMSRQWPVISFESACDMVMQLVDWDRALSPSIRKCLLKGLHDRITRYSFDSYRFIIINGFWSMRFFQIAFTDTWNSPLKRFYFVAAPLLDCSVRKQLICLVSSWMSLFILLQFYLQDTKSSNGTFINSQRLSRGSEESPPCEILSGDIIQFGVDVTENTRKGMWWLLRVCQYIQSVMDPTLF